MIEINYLQECQSFYEKNLKQKYGVPIGCSDDDISNFELEQGISLPSSYRQFLKWMGKDFNGVLRGSEWFLKDVVENISSLDEFLEENEVCFNHLGAPVCFFSHQGYMAAWFYLLEEKLDPFCYYYSEGGSSNQVVSIGKFSEFLLHELEAIN